MGRGKFHRAVGIVIALAAGGAAALLWFAVAAGGPHLDESPSKGLVLGVWNVLYNTDAPALRNIFAAIALALLLAAGIALLERRITNRSRRSANPQAAPLAPRIVMADTRGVFDGPVTVTVLIPAHNEEASSRHHRLTPDPVAPPRPHHRGRGQLHRQHRGPRPAGRRRGDGVRRKHQKEGRRTQPGAQAAASGPGRQRRRDGDGR